MDWSIRKHHNDFFFFFFKSLTAKEAAWGSHKQSNFCEHINRTILLMLWSCTSQKEQTLSNLHSGLHLCYLCHTNHKSKQAHKLAHYCFKAVCQYFFKGVTTAKSSTKHHQLFMKKKNIYILRGFYALSQQSSD